MGKKAGLWFQDKYFRPVVIISSLLLLFGTTFIPLHSITKDGAFILSSLFPILAGWLLGLRLGLVFWFLHALVLMNLARTVGSSMDQLISSGIPQYAITFLITSGVGRIRDLTKSLRHELKERCRAEAKLIEIKDTLEKQVEKRTEELMLSNKKLEQEIRQNKKTAEEKLKLQLSLKRAEKMEAVGILAGSVAHDLNNILTGIMSYPELLLLDISKDSPLRGPLLTIQDSGQRAAAVVQDLLTLVRKGIINAAAVNLNHIISDFLNSPEYKKMESNYPGTTIETSLQQDLPAMYGSPVHLSKAVMNLVLNSLEAMAKGGHITITTAGAAMDKSCDTYEVMNKGSYVSVTVSDNGPGISKEDLNRIFEPFYTKKVMGRSGTGLGLAIVWGTVKDHDGYVDVQSRKGEGTTFTLFFPVADEDISSREPSLTPQDYTGSGESILIIDDDNLQRDLCTKIVKKLGYSAHCVNSGEQAVEYLTGNSADLIILDMIMEGGMDGFETYKKIISLHPGQKAIIVSGFTESEQVRDTQALGAGRFIRKPYAIEELGIALQNELHRRDSK